jgi:hypothetical protein
MRDREAAAGGFVIRHLPPLAVEFKTRVAQQISAAVLRGSRCPDRQQQQGQGKRHDYRK